MGVETPPLPPRGSQMAKLSAAAVRSKTCPPDKRRPVRFPDGDGLYLQVAPGDTRSWLFRYTRYGKAREKGLGPAAGRPGEVPLAEARRLAGEARTVLRDGRDPINERRDRKAAIRRAEL